MCCPLRPVACQAGDEHEPAGAPRKRCYLSDLGQSPMAAKSRKPRPNEIAMDLSDGRSGNISEGNRTVGYARAGWQAAA